MGAVAEKPETAGRALLFVGLAEGIAIYGLIIAIMILGRGACREDLGCSATATTCAASRLAGVEGVECRTRAGAVEALSTRPGGDPSWRSSSCPRARRRSAPT